jgi:perosamine synthetase
MSNFKRRISRNRFGKIGINVIQLSAPSIGRAERKAVDKVLRSGNLAQGNEVSNFEREFSKFVGNRDCIAVNSGTSGLHISMLAAGIDEVIVPSFSFAATANSVALTGATPVFVDIDIRTFNIDVSAIEAAITPRTKGIQPVHLYGLPAEMESIIFIAKKYNLFIFEDAAQAHLARIAGDTVGQFGDFATFSFYPTKNMTSGEGGMIVCARNEHTRLCKLLRNQGMERRYENEVIGLNNRMTDIHAAIGRIQLEKLEKLTKKRQENANFYNENLIGVIKPFTPNNYEHVYHQYTIRIEGLSRDDFANELKKRGISSGVYYPIPIHKLPSFNKKLDLVNTEIACKQVLSIPVHPKLKKRDLERIVETINSLSRAGA